MNYGNAYKYGIKRISGGAAILGIEELKAHSRIEVCDEDSVILQYISAAQKYIEDVTGTCFGPTQYLMAFDSFPDPFCEISLPRTPLISLDGITYVDALDGVTKTLDPSRYTADDVSITPRIAPAYLQFWPITLPVINAVKVTFTAGHPDNDDPVIAPLKQLTAMLAAGWYQHREPVASGINVTELPAPIGFSSLLAPYTLPGF